MDETATLTSSLRLVATLLEAAWDHLHADSTCRTLEVLLHSDSFPPEAPMAILADRIIDAAGDLCTLLEPSHLILADHFLGRRREERGEASLHSSQWGDDADEWFPQGT